MKEICVFLLDRELLNLKPSRYSVDVVTLFNKVRDEIINDKIKHLSSNYKYYLTSTLNLIIILDFKNGDVKLIPSKLKKITKILLIQKQKEFCNNFFYENLILVRRNWIYDLIPNKLIDEKFFDKVLSQFKDPKIFDHIVNKTSHKLDFLFYHFNIFYRCNNKSFNQNHIKILVDQSLWLIDQEKEEFEKVKEIRKLIVRILNPDLKTLFYMKKHLLSDEMIILILRKYQSYDHPDHICNRESYCHCVIKKIIPERFKQIN